jgi:hypothetical protein
MMGKHLGEVLPDERVEEDLVSLLETPEVRVLREWRRFAPERAIRTVDLLVEGRHVRREQAFEPQRDPLLLGEARPLVG